MEVLAEAAGAALSPWRPSDVSIFRPYPDEVPWDLLAAAGVDEQSLAGAMDLNFLRVAKLDGRALGAYGIRPRSELCYELVTLIVAEGYRRKGLGRWLLGHAIGLAETKGGREIVVGPGTGQAMDAAAARFVERAGFRQQGPEWRLVLTPE